MKSINFLWTRSQNAANRKRTKRKGLYRGVTRLPSGNYMASIKIKKKSIHIGTFKTQEEAARAYDIKAKYYFHEFAVTNFD